VVQRVTLAQFISTVGDHEEQWEPSHLTRKEAHEIKTGRIGPVHVLQDKDEGTDRGKGGESVAHRSKEGCLGGASFRPTLEGSERVGRSFRPGPLQCEQLGPKAIGRALDQLVGVPDQYGRTLTSRLMPNSDG
jgi:hypothetical protein